MIGYRLHIEGQDTVPAAFESMEQVRLEQRELAKKYGRTFAEIERMSYILTEEEYHDSLLV
jgi:hypothetical protein